MTLIVGIACADGVVMAADSAATYGVLGQQTVRQPTRKLEILSESLIVGVSGPVGMGQRYVGELARLWEQKHFKGSDLAHQAMDKLRAAILPTIKDEFSMAAAAQPVLGNVAAQHAISSALVAIPVQKVPCLFQFNHQGSPEQATARLPFVAIGSGQMTADPFLAFIRELLWGSSRRSYKACSPPIGLYITRFALALAGSRVLFTSRSLRRMGKPENSGTLSYRSK